jgi:hypothetical protein
VSLSSRNGFYILLTLLIVFLSLHPITVMGASSSDSENRPVAPAGLRIGGPEPGPVPNGLLAPDDLVYQGSFRLPEKVEGGSGFGYGGHNIAFNPSGDPGGATDGYPGSLYISGHVHDQLVAEVSIPKPVISPTKDVTELSVASALQPFTDVTGGMRDFAQIEYGPTKSENSSGQGFKLGGMLFLDAGDGMKLYWTVFEYYNVSDNRYPSHGYSTLMAGSPPDPKGLWYLENYHPQMTAGYIFDAPEPFANGYFAGKRLISGLQVSQGIATSSKGPAMFAFAPWQHATLPPEHEAHLDAIPLLYYPTLEQHAPDYKACDAWRGGAWPVSGDKQAVLIVGRKSLGEVFYGNGRPTDCSPYKGYHCTPYEPQILFYDPADLAAVARGEREPWSVVPYYTWNPQEHVWPTCEGSLSGIAIDHQNKLLYLLQPRADRVTNQYEPRPLVHVFRVR